MIPTVGVIVCLYVFVRCIEIAAAPENAEIVKALAGFAAIAALAGAGLVLRAAYEAGQVLQPAILP